MYAVISPGGKQYRVEEGQRLAVELLNTDLESTVDFSPVLVVDGASVLATPAELAGASVSAKVVGADKGPKITGFTYKSKKHQSKRWGHRQKYDLIEITKIAAG